MSRGRSRHGPTLDLGEIKKRTFLMNFGRLKYELGLYKNLNFEFSLYI